MNNIIKGVYVVRNLVNDEFYIGSSTNISRRWANHKSPSQWKAHKCKLYEAIQKYGLENFSFSILEEVNDNRNLKEIENFYITNLKPAYNINAAYLDFETFKREKDEARTKRNKEICIYKGKRIQLNSLYHKLKIAGVSNAWYEATKYLEKNER